MVESTLQDAVSSGGRFPITPWPNRHLKWKHHILHYKFDKIQIFLQTDAGRKAADGNGGKVSASMFLGQSRFLGTHWRRDRPPS